MMTTEQAAVLWLDCPLRAYQLRFLAFMHTAGQLVLRQAREALAPLRS